MRQKRLFQVICTIINIFNLPKTFSSYYLSPNLAIQVATFNDEKA